MAYQRTDRGGTRADGGELSLPSRSGSAPSALEKERERLTQTPLVDCERVSRLCPVTQIILADMENDCRRKLLERGSILAATHHPDAARQLEQEVERQKAALYSMISISEEARFLPVAAFYSSARNGPFWANPRAVEATGIIVDKLINLAAPPTAPDYAPGVSISNGGGSTGGMKCVNAVFNNE